MSKITNIYERQDIDNPVVSIACTTYNQKKFIKKTLEGFLIQKTSFPVEIVIHDDASTDGTKEIIKEYENKYPHLFRVIYQTENQYSKKIDIANKFVYPKIKSKYVATCEGDDYWTDPLKLQKQVNFLDKNDDYGLVYTEVDSVDGDGNIIDRAYFKNDPASFCETFEDYLVYAPFRAPCTWLFRRSLYKERNDKYNVADLPMLLDIVANSKIHKLKDVTANYRVLLNSASHSTNIDKFYKFSKGVYNVQLDYANKFQVEKKVIDIIKIRFVLQFYDFSIAKEDFNQIKAANKILKQQKNIPIKFKVAAFLSNFKIGRKIVRYRLIKKIGYNHK